MVGELQKRDSFSSRGSCFIVTFVFLSSHAVCSRTLESCFLKSLVGWLETRRPKDAAADSEENSVMRTHENRHEIDVGPHSNALSHTEQSASVFF